MSKNILVEGIDCAGKSSLVKELKNTLNWDVKQLHHRDGDQLHRYFREFTFNTGIVFERGHLSEIVYSQIFGRAEPFTPGDKELIHEYCRSKMIIILAIPSINTAIERFRARKVAKQVVSRADIIRGNQLFREFQRIFPDAITYRSRNWKEMQRVISRVHKMVNHDLNRPRNH